MAKEEGDKNIKKNDIKEMEMEKVQEGERVKQARQ